MNLRHENPRAPRIGVVVQGDPTSPRTWSGSPAGIIKGLEAHGVEVVPVDATPPWARRMRSVLRLHWSSDATNPMVVSASEQRAEAGLRRGRVDGAVAIGSGFRLHARRRFVTFEDETVVQALRQEPSDLARLNKRERNRWIGRQRQIYERAQGCCVGSGWVGRSIDEDYSIDPGKIHVVGFGRNLVSGPLERDWSTPRFLFLGVNWELKRGPAVLEAFARIRERHPDATLDVVGRHPPIDLPGVFGHGFLSLASDADRARMIALLAGATCLVLPSRREAFGIAYADAASAGVPSIGTSVGGAAETIGDGGVVVRPGDEEALFGAMLDLCDPMVAANLGRRAREYATAFTWEGVAGRILRALALPAVAPTELPPFLIPRRAPTFTGSAPDMDLAALRNLLVRGDPREGVAP